MFRTLLAAIAIAIASVCLAPSASAEGPYANCTDAKADGAYNITQDDPDYWPGGDRDRDGIACEA